MKTAQRKINQVIKWRRTWLLETAPELMNYTARVFNDNMAEASLPALRYTDSLLSRLGRYYGTKGGIELVDQEPGAWDSIYLSCAFHLHQVRLGFALWSRLAD